MKVNVNGIKGDKQTFELSEKVDWCLAACSEGAEGEVDSLKGHLTLLVRSSHVETSGHVRVLVQRNCDRCGEITELQIRDEFTLKYYPEEELSDEERELAVDDLGVGWFQNDVLDLKDVLCEIIALSLPNRVVCSDEEGCEQRMTDLIGKSQVEPLTGHPGFAALRGFGKVPKG